MIKITQVTTSQWKKLLRAKIRLRSVVFSSTVPDSVKGVALKLKKGSDAELRKQNRSDSRIISEKNNLTGGYCPWNWTEVGKSEG